MAEKVETEVPKDNVGAGEMLQTNDNSLSEMEELLIKTYCFSIQYNAGLALGLINNNSKLERLKPYFSSIHDTAIKGILPVIEMYNVKK